MAAPAAVFPSGVEAQQHIAELVPRLRRYARALANNRTPADELVRATLERAAGEVSLTHTAGDLRVWLFGLMHEIYMRSAANETSAAAEPHPGTGAPAGGDPPRRASEEAIATLPAEQREIFLLVTLEDMSYEQVATTLNIPIGTVMSRLSRAREKLRLQLMSQARLRMVK